MVPTMVSTRKPQTYLNSSRNSRPSDPRIHLLHARHPRVHRQACGLCAIHTHASLDGPNGHCCGCCGRARTINSSMMSCYQSTLRKHARKRELHYNSEFILAMIIHIISLGRSLMITLTVMLKFSSQQRDFARQTIKMVLKLQHVFVANGHWPHPGKHECVQHTVHWPAGGLKDVEHGEDGFESDGF